VPKRPPIPVSPAPGGSFASDNPRVERTYPKGRAARQQEPVALRRSTRSP
jgi:hypothetical protein